MTVTYDAGTHVTRDRWLCLHRNENFFVDSQWLAETQTRVMTRVPVASYPDSDCHDLRSALAEAHGVEIDNVFVGNGSDEVLSSLLALLRVDYDTMCAARVGYRMYPVLASRYGFTLELLSQSSPTSVSPPCDRPIVFAVDSPNAITGEPSDPAWLDGLAETDRAFLIWDNCYGEFADDQLAACTPNRVVVRTFSKYYGLAGLRVGYCLGAAPIVDRLHARKDIFNVNGAAQAMALEALQHPEVFERARAEMVRARTELMATLTDAGFVVVPSAGNFVLASHRDLSAAAIHEALAARCIAVRRFTGIGIDNCLRITVPDPRGAERLRSAFREIAAQAAV
jgi:histidinol-phosphate aminotransferase